MDRCHQPEDLARILDLPNDAPERRHLDDCPRCRNLARRYRAFLAPGPLPAEADAPEASAVLGRRLAEIIPLPVAVTVNLGTATQHAADLQDAPPARRRPRRHWYALAAVFVLAVGVLALRSQLFDPEATPRATAPLLRGGVGDLDTPRVEAVAGGLALTWSPIPDAERTVIVVLSADLRVLAEIPAAGDARHTFADAGGDHALPADARYVQIRFERGGAAVSTSALLALPAR